MVLNAISILMLVVLIVTISIDTFKNNHDLSFHNIYMRVQLWVCIFFLFTLIVQFFLADNRRVFVRRNLIFFFISLPYLSIFEILKIHFPTDVHYLLRFIPLVRGGYALAYVIMSITPSKTSGVFFSYMLSFVFLIYSYSLVFYVSEFNVNPMVSTYFDSLWWAWMNAVTLGCSIEAVTVLGKVLSVITAMSGITMFPFFTVYIIHLIQNMGEKRGKYKANFLDIYNQKDNQDDNQNTDNDEKQQVDNNSKVAQNNSTSDYENNKNDTNPKVTITISSPGKISEDTKNND